MFVFSLNNELCLNELSIDRKSSRGKYFFVTVGMVN